MYLAYKNTNILYKILPCILIAIFLIMILSSSSFASSSILIDGNEYLLSNFFSNYSHLLICKSSVHGYYLVVVSNSPIVVDNNTFYTVSEGSKYDINIVDLSSFLCNTSDLVDCFPSGNLTANLKDYSSVDFIYSSYDIKDSDGNVVFQAAPQEGELAPTIKSINFLEVVKEVLAILPIILLTVIGLLALRKAIRLILKMLHQM